ncbi:SHOCT domain-containing protein [Arthrobacter psychrolactophilus]|uniref:SHOCT domain-containing protein n=1 Tax=Arthrobacter psychrolactophilus TaxID=92442 RepID=A0A2V5INA7_9MICC|nr:SHOCT domain-containing protein [Arthrobacter psychrolactophilus]PYI38045.1 SHOCT domain-containing protein [Arthrobacter psychrolactophilus]
MPFVRRNGRPGLIGLAARTAVVAGTASAVNGAVVRHQAGRAAEAAQPVAIPPAPEQYPPAAPPQQLTVAAPAAPVDIVAKLQQLGDMRAQGLLSDPEFELAKRQLLGN